MEFSIFGPGRNDLSKIFPQIDRTPEEPDLTERMEFVMREGRAVLAFKGKDGEVRYV
ncbi:hypothetical protein [Paraburkholderia caledonica]|uniref:Uncharacterized protein n=1 Tax=Paraburkholderia caledonica TaxID=134536 RepID=A0AB73INX2_9BURK|nr:hypothetical protein [Paraburkholderia caledonica]